jgi:predicted DsbA family dithiol-disulfide isomerase
MDNVSVTIFTDPGCPFGFNAQRQELQLAWHYGRRIEITRRMIVLREKTLTFEEQGVTRDQVTALSERLRAQYGMPMLTDSQDAFRATLEACQAYVGARINAAERADQLLRSLRRRMFSQGQHLDDPTVIRTAGEDVGMRGDTFDRWLHDNEVAAALREDMEATRSPSREALALPHRLSRTNDGLRYSTASAVFERGDSRMVTVGFQPFAVYEMAMANVAPDVERQPPPETVEQILEWAPYPLATAEVAALRDIGLDDARRELEQSGASLEPAAGDGYWSPGSA